MTRLFVRFHLTWLRFWAWLLATTPEESVRDDVYLPDEELANLPKPLHRLKEFRYQRMACGHHPFEFCAPKGQCLQCVAEGRVAAKDGGRLQ
jgi:hypothetical protein